MKDKSPLSLCVLAPCKVNLTLDVGSRRADGFHDIDSIVATFLPADKISITVTAETERPCPVTLVCDDSALPVDNGNLAYRAAEAFHHRFLSKDTHIALDLRKQLPAQAGLGGGSSNAAAVLRGLAHLCGVDARDALLALAADIGSDVALFLAETGNGVRMQGRGEQVTPLDRPLPPLYGVLVKSACGVPTGPAYALLDALAGRQPGDSTERLLAELAADGGLDAIAATFSNDFEAAILPAYPEVARAHEAVRAAGALRALLCGSGSAVFGVARDADHARALHQALRDRFPWSAVATPVTEEERHV